ncbi:histidinol-phosphate transaminase [Xanthomonas campestris pv. campestris]|uniref:histidinol-phosphate transaminase n=1 Tax=Xanthomonas TaxID=338 RepID=UPI001D158B04|nr:histidinol-phosphate transaminase [Xanthomonas campestris]MCC3256321.1 histidinol-phosphate transaminase [Xanthomonas campestris pv. armoraciae]MCC5042768.1 histidinol-phosphate transaminase [Xanthomonas campestris]MDM7583394.1 histidinol-phosphate transaminase [Xanthomonas campestris]MDM7590681.1 histidinol-phosphate transaminase [Xanthomonas campestris]MEA9862855.1 histidinol-phosphate transaminase [Xanthomonas campestris pv. raphani]
MSTASVMDLVRDDLRAFAGYASARTSALQGDVWLNANESAWGNPADPDASTRRYPDPQPKGLRAALAQLYGCAPEQLLIGRGSDEAIDLLVRGLCVPERDAVVVTPPVFGMYAVCARLQNAPLVEVPLVDGAEGFHADVPAIVQAALDAKAKLVFLCSPSNPAGSAIPLAEIEVALQALQGKAVVVVDEAYGEFSDVPSAIGLLARYDNLAVLRTLSKAHALAAARIGSLIANAELIALLRRCQAPYPVPTPCAVMAEQALSAPALAVTQRRVTEIRAERARLHAALVQVAGVRQVYPSQGNFLLVRFDDAEAAFQALLEAGVVVRDQRAVPRLSDALRITIGTPEQNDRVLGALQRKQEAA